MYKSSICSLFRLHSTQTDIVPYLQLIHHIQAKEQVGLRRCAIIIQVLSHGKTRATTTYHIFLAKTRFLVQSHHYQKGFHFKIINHMICPNDPINKTSIHLLKSTKSSQQTQPKPNMNPKKLFKKTRFIETQQNK